MSDEPNLRNNDRIPHKAEIQFENFFSRTFNNARMYNYSLGEMYFEAEYAPLPGTEIYIGIKNSPYHYGPDLYRARIRWRKELDPPASGFHYGVGVQYDQPVKP